MAELDTRIPMAPLGFNGQRRDSTDGLRKALTLKVLLDQQQLMPLQVRGAEMGLERQRMEMEAARSAREGQMQARQQVEQMLMQRDPSGQLLTRFRMDPEGAMSQLWPQKAKPVSVAAGASLVDPDTGKPVYSAPPQSTPTSLAKMISERDALPPGDPRRMLYDAAIAKDSSHPPGTNVYTGTMVKGEVDGKPVFLMPSKDGTAAVVPNVAPEGTKAGEESRTLRQNAAMDRAGIVVRKIDDALDKVGFFTTGLTGSLVGQVAGTKAYDLRRDVDTVKANIGFQELQQMREMSPTGGALGQVAVQELNMLQAVLSSLDANQSQEQIRANLTAARKHFNNWKDAVAKSQGQPSPEPRSAAPQADNKTLTEADLQATMRGAEARGRPMTRQEAIRLLTGKGYKFGGGASGGF